jgi:Domain of unknown function (DUF4386)
MENNNKRISLSTAALIAGFAILGSVATAPFAEIYVYPKIVIPDNAQETAKNIIENKLLFTSAIFAYFITFLLDVVIAWALYIFLKPVNESLSLLTAWLRLVYAIIAVISLNNLVTALRLLTTPDYAALFHQDQLYAQVMIYVRAFRYHWYFGILFFGIHLLFLGYLVFCSGYVPKILGIVLIITGLGYLLTTVRPYLFPGVNVDFAQFTFYGELIFMLWLLIRGSRVKKPIS